MLRFSARFFEIKRHILQCKCFDSNFISILTLGQVFLNSSDFAFQNQAVRMLPLSLEATQFL